MDYLETTLHIRVRYEEWKYVNQLPYYIADRYDVQLAHLDGINALFLHFKTEPESLTAIKKHIKRIKELENIPVVLVLETMTTYQRKAFIMENIPFVIDGKQIYLPFLGILLKEKGDKLLPARKTLQPSAQLIVLYFIYANKNRLCTNEIVKVLNITAMTVSRAVRQLHALDLLAIGKEGKQNIIESNLSGKEFTDKVWPHLASPVRKRIYIAKDSVDSEMPQAGYTALSQMSMLNEPQMACYAIDKYACGKGCTQQILDADRHVCLEIWAYDPRILANNGMVDPLSLALALQNDIDERVEEALHELLNEFWRNYNGKRN